MKIQISTLLLIAISLSFISQTAVNCQSITEAQEEEEEYFSEQDEQYSSTIYEDLQYGSSEGEEEEEEEGEEEEEEEGEEEEEEEDEQYSSNIYGDSQYGSSEGEEEEEGQTNSSTTVSSQTTVTVVQTSSGAPYPVNTMAGDDPTGDSSSSTVSTPNSNDGYQIMAFIVVMIPLTLISSI